MLYSDSGVYYVGLASSAGGIGSRLKDYLTDDHQDAWSRFSWFAFDGPSESETYPDGVIKHEEWSSVEGTDVVIIRELEALLLAVTSPPGNVQRTKFQHGAQWFQVADRVPAVMTFNELKDRL